MSVVVLTPDNPVLQEIFAEHPELLDKIESISLSGKDYMDIIEVWNVLTVEQTEVIQNAFVTMLQDPNEIRDDVKIVYKR